MIPIESRWFIGWYLDLVSKRRWTRLDQSIDHVILVADRGNIQPVKMEIRGVEVHGLTLAGIGGSFDGIVRVRHWIFDECAGRNFDIELVRQIDDKRIATIHTESRRFDYALGSLVVETIMHVARGVGSIAQGQTE